MAVPVLSMITWLAHTDYSRSLVKSFQSMAIGFSILTEYVLFALRCVSLTVIPWWLLERLFCLCSAINRPLAPHPTSSPKVCWHLFSGQYQQWVVHVQIHFTHNHMILHNNLHEFRLCTPISSKKAIIIHIMYIHGSNLFHTNDCHTLPALERLYRSLKPWPILQCVAKYVIWEPGSMLSKKLTLYPSHYSS